MIFFIEVEKNNIIYDPNCIPFNPFIDIIKMKFTIKGPYMGKAAMCIKMLEILNTGRVYKLSELADFLETNPRNIVEYKKSSRSVDIISNQFQADTADIRLRRTTLFPH